MQFYNHYLCFSFLSKIVAVNLNTYIILSHNQIYFLEYINFFLLCPFFPWYVFQNVQRLYNYFFCCLKRIFVFERRRLFSSKFVCQTLKKKKQLFFCIGFFWLKGVFEKTQLKSKFLQSKSNIYHVY